jgi:hypothetical protein
MFFNHFGWWYESVGIATCVIWIRVSFLNMMHAVIAFFACSGKLLKKEDWENKKLIPISASIPREDEPQAKYFGSGENPIQFTALRVNLNQVKKLWPMENTKP